MDLEDQKWIDENLNPEAEKEIRGEYSEATYTLSFINGQPGLVVRADHSQELINRISKVLPIYKRFREAIQNGVEEKKAAPNASPEVQAFCQVHGIQMAKGISRKTNKEYFYHDSPEGNRCFGKGYMPKQA
jgi:predicted rRNA methylase YqxC with S4 and FtsJ domains